MSIKFFSGNPPEHIKTWLKEQYADSGWNFDIAKTGNYIAQKQLQDIYANWCGGDKLNLYQLQTLDDNTLMFGTQKQGHPYIWKFEDGHSFEVSFLKDTYESKGNPTIQYKTAIVSKDGTKLFETHSDYNTSLYMTELTTPFELSSANYTNRVRVFSNIEGSSNKGIYRMQFSPDGKTFIYKSYTSDILKSVVLENPYDFTSIVEQHEQNLQGLNDGNESFFDGIKYSFFFSQTGKDALMTSFVGSVVTWVHHVKFSIPWDITSIKYIGKKQIVSGIPEAIAVNSRGTKLIVVIADIFYEYDLVQ